MKEKHTDWIEKFSNFNTWRQKGVRAPHKPLLTLLLLRRSMDNKDSKVEFREISEQLANLLKEFGPSRKVYHPEFPFWHLQSEGFWIVSAPVELERRKPGSSPTKAALLKDGVYGEIVPELWDTLNADSSLVAQLTDTILNQFWPETLHDSIRNTIGLPDVVQNSIVRRKRDPEFRINVLRAYRSTCAICGLDGRLGGTPLGIQAGHIKWHSCNGPDSINNGLALCPFHHVALDAGAITLNYNLKIIVSSDLTGGKRIEDEIYHYEGREIMIPQPGFEVPKVEFVNWHRKQVFKSPGRLIEPDDSYLTAADINTPKY